MARGREGGQPTHDEHAQPELRWRHLPHWLKGGLIGVGVMFIALVMLLLYLQSSFYQPPTVEPSLPVNGVVAVSALITYPLRHGLYLGITHGNTFVQLFVGLLLGFIVNVLIVFGSGAGISFLVKPKRLTHSKDRRALQRHTRDAHPAFAKGTQVAAVVRDASVQPTLAPRQERTRVETGRRRAAPAHKHAHKARKVRIPRIFE